MFRMHATIFYASQDSSHFYSLAEIIYFMEKINTVNFLIAYYFISLVKTASIENNQTTYTVSRSMISIKLKTLTWAKPSITCQNEDKRRGKKRQQNWLRQANLQFIYYQSFCLFTCFQNDSEQKNGLFSILLWKFSKEKYRFLEITLRIYVPFCNL